MRTKHQLCALFVQIEYGVLALFDINKVLKTKSFDFHLLVVHLIHEENSSTRDLVHRRCRQGFNKAWLIDQFLLRVEPSLLDLFDSFRLELVDLVFGT